MTCIRYRRGYKYQLAAAYAVFLPEMAGAVSATVSTAWLDLDSDGALRIRAGYAWDGASGPTWDSKSTMRGSLVHDALYQLMRLGLLSREWRGEADRLFVRICREDKMWSIRVSLWRHMVRVFARPATEAAAEPEVEAAGCGCPDVLRAEAPVTYASPKSPPRSTDRLCLRHGIWD